jgi:hypothetical protein
MAHMVLKKGKYWELHESYRDERGRPRKRFLRYLGCYSAQWKETRSVEFDGVDWAKIERMECERLDREKAAYDAKLAALNEQYGLRVGPVDPTPVEKQSPAASAASVPEQGAPQSDQSSERDADGNAVQAEA